MTGEVERRPPRGLLKAVFRAPDWLYRANLGWILGKRVLALTHRGRKSGTARRTVLEVVSYDRESKESIVASAWGTAADWYRNIQAEPALRVQTGFSDYTPVQRLLTAEEAMATARRFCDEHPFEARLVNRVLPAIGADVPDDTALTPWEVIATLPMVGFRPPA